MRPWRSSTRLTTAARKNFSRNAAQGDKVIYYEALDDYGEASFVVDTIAQLVASRQFEPGDCAVMYRTNAQSRLLEEAFLQARLPYRLVGAQRFYGRREVKDMISFLRLVHNPADEISLDRVINVPPRGIGDKTILTLHTVARQAEISPGEVLLDLSRGRTLSIFGVSSRGARPCPCPISAGCCPSGARWPPHATVPELFDQIIEDTSYKEYLDDGTEEGKDRWDNVLELRRVADEYAQRELSEFLENVALVSDQDTLRKATSPPC